MTTITHAWKGKDNSGAFRWVDFQVNIQIMCQNLTQVKVEVSSQKVALMHFIGCFEL